MTTKKQLIQENPYACAVNNEGLQIHSIEHGIDDKVFGVDGTDLFLHKITYTTTGKAYFTRNDRRYYMNEFMRV